ncbi:hypothetical protein IWZ03DRAFT_405222 [Phyllosticta citriasiana]|uniref:Uncharacterized protein n=1 Tax=Phyllosticta citriasiana TaxID=595635 RepID=A0ABR1KT41_9PEZI
MHTHIHAPARITNMPNGQTSTHLLIVRRPSATVVIIIIIIIITNTSRQMTHADGRTGRREPGGRRSAECHAICPSEPGCAGWWPDGRMAAASDEPVPVPVPPSLVVLVELVVLDDGYMRGWRAPSLYEQEKADGARKTG